MFYKKKYSKIIYLIYIHFVIYFNNHYNFLVGFEANKICNRMFKRISSNKRISNK